MAKATNADYFVYSTQFNIEKPETYISAIQDPNALQ